MAIMRAKKTAMITDARGKRRKITKGVTTADGEAQIVQDKPHLWGPLEVDFPAESPRRGSGEALKELERASPAFQAMGEMLTAVQGLGGQLKREAETAVVPARNPTQNLAAPDLSPGLDPKGRPLAATTIIRKWAQEQGIPVSKSGYIAKDVIEQYIEAHS